MAEKQQVRRAGSIIRVCDTNLTGSWLVKRAIRNIPGVGFQFGNAVSIVSGLGDKTLESLSEDELKRLVEIIQNPEKHSLPKWLLNRRKDPKTGVDRHLVSSGLEFNVRMDINEMKKLRIYKGIRHAAGLPVRGQRTLSSFRKGKTIGVSRSKQAPAKAGAGKEKK